MNKLRASRINTLIAEFMNKETIEHVNEMFKPNISEYEVSSLIDIDGYTDLSFRIVNKVKNLLRESGALE